MSEQNQAENEQDKTVASSENAEVLTEAEQQESLEETEVSEDPEFESLSAIEFEPEQKAALIEAILFANGEPLGVSRIRQVTGLPEKEVQDILESISMKFEIEDSGFRLVNVGGKYQFRTVQQFAPFVRLLKSSGPKKLSPAALETLAIVAYRQPIVKSDVEKIRGVDATPTLKTLLERRMIKIVGHKAAVGQPALYGTTDLFLKIFGLSSLNELPSLRDLKELEMDPGEVGEQTELFSDEDLDQLAEEEQEQLMNRAESNDDAAEVADESSDVQEEIAQEEMAQVENA